MIHNPKEKLIKDINIFIKFNNWMDEKTRSSLADKIKISEGDYKSQLLKISRKLDFFRTFIIICELSLQNITDKDERDKYIKDIVGSVFGRLIFETTDISILNRLFSYLLIEEPDDIINWIKNRKMGLVWIKKTFIETLINKYIEEFEKSFSNDYCKREIFKISRNISVDNLELTFIDQAKIDFALMAGASYTDVESMMARGISRATLCNILYNCIFIRILIDSLKENLILTAYEDGELFTGNSGINHYFDGIIILNDEEKMNPWLLFCFSSTHNPLVAAESVDSKLNDIGMKKCILFIPAYASQNALRYSVYTYAKNHNEIMILYLSDLYNIIRLCDEDIIRYLNKRRIQ